MSEDIVADFLVNLVQSCLAIEVSNDNSLGLMSLKFILELYKAKIDYTMQNETNNCSVSSEIMEKFKEMYRNVNTYGSPICTMNSFQSTSLDFLSHDLISRFQRIFQTTSQIAYHDMDQKLDGVVYLSKNWNILAPRKLVSIKLPLFIKRLNASSELKGSRLINSSSTIYKVRLFEIQDLECSIIFYGKRMNQSFSAQLREVTKALLSAVHNLKQTETYRLNSSKFGYKKLASTFSGSFILLIYPSDFENVGKYFAQQVIGSLTGKPDINYCFMFSAFGQSMPIQMYDQNAHVLQDHVEESLYHINFDFINYMEDYVFWKRQAFCEACNVSPGKVSHEYYPLALGGLGNFYIHFDQTNCESTVTIVKAYSNLFRHFHLNKEAPSPFEIAFFLWEMATTGFLKQRSSEISLQKKKAYEYLNYAKILDYLAEDALSCRKNYARLELIVSTMGGGSFLTGSRTANEFMETRLQQLKKCLTKVPKQSIKERMQEYLIPCAHTLKHYTCNLFKTYFDDMSGIFEFGPGDFANVAASQCIATFMIRGTHFEFFRSNTDMNQTRRNAYKIYRDLGLTTRKCATANNIFPALGSDTIRLRSGLMTYVPTFSHLDIVSRTGIENIFSYSVLLGITFKKVISESEFNTICSMLRNLIIYSIKVSFGLSMSSISYQELYSLVPKIPKKTVVQCETFTSLLFAESFKLDKTYTCVIWFLKRIQRSFQNRLYANEFPAKFAEFLNKDIEENDAALVFPIKQNADCYLIVPKIKRDENHCNNMHVYQLAYKLKFGNSIPLLRFHMRVLKKLIPKFMDYLQIEEIFMKNYTILSEYTEEPKKKALKRKKHF